MISPLRIGWFGLGCLALAACNAAPDNAVKEQQTFSAAGATARAKTKELGAAGETALTDEELDRLLDALEQELHSEGTGQ